MAERSQGKQHLDSDSATKAGNWRELVHFGWVSGFLEEEGDSYR
jgi:hypothetical protein